MFCAVLIGIGYFYMQKNLDEVENKVENVLYEQESCENKGVLFVINGEKTFFYLDFEKNELLVSLYPEEEIQNIIYGYEVDFKVGGDLNILSEIVDYIGGIELENEEGKFRYTGIQISEIYNVGSDLKRSIIEQICKKIGECGLALDFFANIIENYQTDLTIPDCYFWCEELGTLCNNLKIID